MDVSGKTIAALAVALAVFIVAHQAHLHRARARAEAAAREDARAAATARRAATPLPGMSPDVAQTSAAAADEGATAAATETAPPSVANPHDDPAVIRRLVEEQAWLLEQYALQAGPDDPFSMTKEQIEEFRKRGDPFVW